MAKPSPQPRLAKPTAAPTFDAGAQANYSERFELAFALVGTSARRNWHSAARVWAHTLRGVTERVGSWRYKAQHPRAIALWCGPEGWAARLLRLELDLCERDNAAARNAHAILRPLFEEIARREIGAEYEREVAA